jgi:agmatinase
MKKLYEQWPFNFGAIHKQDFKKSKITIIPLPYDATASYKSNQREGPYAIINASRFIDELFDCQEDLIGLKSSDIFTLDEFVVSKNSVQEAMKGIEQLIWQEVISKNKIPIVLGGEHSITYGVVKAVKKKYHNLSVLQFDAHADLLNEYEGTKYSHACVMRRILELKVPAVQLGIRNMNTEVQDYLSKNKKQAKNIHFAPCMPPLQQILDGLTENVYLTFDLDAFDPSIMPSVGTAEPGGFFWDEVIEVIEAVSKRVNIVGADVVELSPHAGIDAPNFLAAKLVYKIIINILKSKKI